MQTCRATAALFSRAVYRWREFLINCHTVQARLHDIGVCVIIYINCDRMRGPSPQAQRPGAHGARPPPKPRPRNTLSSRRASTLECSRLHSVHDVSRVSVCACVVSRAL